LMENCGEKKFHAGREEEENRKKCSIFNAQCSMFI
jgi:hypothetical protein